MTNQKSLDKGKGIKEKYEIRNGKELNQVDEFLVNKIINLKQKHA